MMKAEAGGCGPANTGIGEEGRGSATL